MSNKPPVRIRRNVESYHDPYITEECLPENTVCIRCGSVYASSRWYLKDLAPPRKNLDEPVHKVTCPACRRQSEKVPGGIVTLAGAFISQHMDEILNLIRNESDKAQTVNPLERIIEMEPIGNSGGLTITTTNEKLAQRLGKAMHKAYSGTVEYQFGEDTKVARVNWHRE